MKSRNIFAYIIIICALLQITLVILDEFNPVMGFLSSAVSKLFLFGFSIVSLIFSVSVLKNR